jgi:hypothetical protein
VPEREGGRGEQAGCWAERGELGRGREGRGEWEMGRRGKGPAQEGKGGSWAARGKGWAAGLTSLFSLLFFFFSTPFEAQIYLNSNELLKLIPIKHVHQHECTIMLFLK